MFNYQQYPHPSEFTRNGYRALTAEEGDALKWGERVTILNSATGEQYLGTVIGCRRDTVKVQFATSGHILPFDLDDPDLWAERELRDRRPPMAEEDETLFVLVTPDAIETRRHFLIEAEKQDIRLATARVPTREIQSDSTFNAMKASVELNIVLKRLSAVEERLARIESLQILRSI